MVLVLSGCPAAVQRAAAPSRAARPSPRLASVRPQAGTKKAQQFQDEFYEITQQLDALKQKLGDTSTPTTSSPEGKVNSLGYVCDEFGCVLLDTSTNAFSASDSLEDVDMLEEKLSGSGWTLGSETECDSSYCAELGGTDWSISLTAAELKDFITALKALRISLRKLAAAEGQDDNIRIKWDTKTVKVEASCDKAHAMQDQFSVKINVGGLRTVRVSWNAGVVQDVLQHLDAVVPGFRIPTNNGPATTITPIAATPAKPAAVPVKV